MAEHGEGSVQAVTAGFAQPVSLLGFPISVPLALWALGSLCSLSLAPCSELGQLCPVQTELEKLWGWGEQEQMQTGALRW